jgi:hypothetical protein
VVLQSINKIVFVGVFGSKCKDLTSMIDLSNIWLDFTKIELDKLNSGLNDLIIKNNNWDLIPSDLKSILKINNGQDLTKNGIFKKLDNGKLLDCYKYLDFESILKFLKIVKGFKIISPVDNGIPFAEKESQDIGGFGFSINRIDYSINYISFNEYDYNGEIVYNKVF